MGDSIEIRSDGKGCMKCKNSTVSILTEPCSNCMVETRYKYKYKEHTKWEAMEVKKKQEKVYSTIEALEEIRKDPSKSFKNPYGTTVYSDATGWGKTDNISHSIDLNVTWREVTAKKYSLVEAINEMNKNGSKRFKNAHGTIIEKSNVGFLQTTGEAGIDMDCEWTEIVSK